MHISIAQGNRRPHDRLQAAKFASEASIAVVDQIPIFTHFKHYKTPDGKVHFEKFLDRVSVCIATPYLHSIVP